MDSARDGRRFASPSSTRLTRCSPPSEAGEVEALAHSVDELMTEIAQRAGNVDSNRVAVLACLHMADRLQSMERELVELKSRVDEKSRQFSILLDEAAEKGT